MADAIDQQTDASGQADASDTTITDDVFDDIDISDVEDTPDDTGSTTEESTDDSAATEETDDTEEDSAEDVEDKADESDETDADDSKAVDTEPEADAKAREAGERHQRNEEAKARRLAEKQQRDQAKQQAAQEALDQSYQEAYDQAINAGYDDSQARLQAAQALTLTQLQQDAYTNRVMQVTNKVTADLNSAVTQIPEFKSDNPVIRDAMLQAVDQFEAMYVQKDANGDAVAVNGDIHSFLQNQAETIRKLTGLGAQQQGQAKNTQKKRTLSPPSRTPKQPKVDPDLAAFDAEASRW